MVHHSRPQIVASKSAILPSFPWLFHTLTPARPSMPESPPLVQGVCSRFYSIFYSLPTSAMSPQIAIYKRHRLDDDYVKLMAAEMGNGTTEKQVGANS